MRSLVPLAALLLVGCQSKRDASVDGVVLAQARGVSEPPDGPTLRVPGDDADRLPDGPLVRLAIARQTAWKDVDELLHRLEKAGVQPVLLVGQRWRVRAFTLSDPLETEESIALTATIDGKSCVSPPGVPEAKCVQTIDKNHIDVAYTRELVREAVGAYRIHDIDVEVPPTMQWQDVVRTLDAARTCCFGDKVRVKLDR